MSGFNVMLDVGRSVAAAGLVFFGLCVFWFGFQVLTGTKSEYDRNRSRARSPKDVFLGRVSPRRDGDRDDKVAAGIAIRRNPTEWLEQGRFSQEALHDVMAE